MRTDKYILLLNLKKDLSQEQRQDKREYYKNQKLVSKIKIENQKSLDKSLDSIKKLVSIYKINILSRTRVLFIIEKLMDKVRIKTNLTLNELIEKEYAEEISFLKNLLNQIED